MRDRLERVGADRAISAAGGDAVVGELFARLELLEARTNLARSALDALRDDEVMGDAMIAYADALEAWSHGLRVVAELVRKAERRR